MKIAIVHLSDFHIKDKDIIIFKKIDGFISSLKSFDRLDNIIILISGDISARGKTNEYKVFDRLKGTLIKKIKSEICENTFIPIYTVPGNHDIDYDLLNRKSNDIVEAYKNNQIDRLLDDEFNSIENFCSCNYNKFSIDKNRIVAKHFRQYDNFSIQINLINTAPFSTLEHDDRELHYFQDNDYSVIEKMNNIDLCLTVMHHPFDFFYWNTKFKLEDFIAKNNHMLFIGHEHKDKIVEVYNDKKTGLYISKAGEMQWGNSEFSDAFNTIIIDTTKRVFSAYSFTWDNNKDVFKKTENLNNKIINNKTTKLMPLPEFLTELNLDQSLLYKTSFYNEYFVFPTLVPDNNNDETSVKINNINDFYDTLNKHKKLWIKGASHSGKTTLAKHIYNELLNEKIPLILRVSNGRFNIKNLEKTLFSEQYGFEDGDWDRYEQTDKDKKIIIVDDFDLIDNKKTKQKLLLHFEEKYESYIIISSENSSYDIIEDVKEEVEEKYNKKSSFCQLSIYPFFRKKRSLLVKNICGINNITKEKDISAINKLIDRIVQNNASMFTLKPSFIIQYTNFFLQEGQYESKNGEAIFSKVFEYNITSSLLKYSSETELDEIITGIEEISYYMHFNKKDVLKYDELEKVINDYNVNYYVNLNPKDLYDTLIKTNIFKEDNETFALYFCNRNYLAYFVARCLYRKFQSEGEYDDIKYILRNICFGINSDIILFISYLSNNTQIIRSICEYADQIMSDFGKVDFKNNNVNLLSNYGTLPAKKPEEKDIEEYEERKDKAEELSYDIDNIEARGIYKYDESEIDRFYYKLERAIKYTEMICKALPAFNSIMRADQKNSLVEKIYSFPNQIIFEILDPISSDIDAICKQIKQFADEIQNKYQTGKTIDEEKIKEMFSIHAQCTFLSCFNSFSELAVNKKTLDILKSYKYTSIAENLFRLSVLDNSGNTDLFFKEAESFIRDNNQPNLKQLAQRMVRKHLICNNVPQAKKQRIIDKIWGKYARKQVLLSLPKSNEV